MRPCGDDLKIEIGCGSMASMVLRSNPKSAREPVITATLAHHARSSSRIGASGSRPFGGSAPRFPRVARVRVRRRVASPRGRSPRDDPGWSSRAARTDCRATLRTSDSIAADRLLSVPNALRARRRSRRTRRSPLGSRLDRVIGALGVAIPGQMLLEDQRPRRDRQAAGGLQRGVIAVAHADVRSPRRCSRSPRVTLRIPGSDRR